MFLINSIYFPKVLRFYVQNLKTNPKLSASDLTEYNASATGKNACAESVSRILINEDFHGRVLKKISDYNISERTKQYIDK